MRRQIVLTKLNAIFSSSLLVSDADVERSYREQAERAAVRYLVLPATGFQSQATLSPAEVASYFERHADEFRLPPQRVVNYLLVDTVRTRAKMTFEKADLESYYNSHLDDFKQEEQVHARHILLKVDDSRTAEAAESAIVAARQRVEAGEDFAKLATELSDDPGSKTRGGDLGFFGRGRMIKEFEEAAFNAEAELAGRTDPHQLRLSPDPGAREARRRAEAVRRGRAAGPLPPRRRARRLPGGGQGDGARGEDRRRRAHHRSAVEGAGRQRHRDVHHHAAVRRRRGGRRDRPRHAVLRRRLRARGRQDLDADQDRARLRHSLAGLREPGAPARAGRGRGQGSAGGLRAKAGELALARLDQARGALASGKSLDDVAKELAVEVKESGEFGRDGNIEGLADSRGLIAAALAGKAGDVGTPILTEQGAVLFQITARKGFDAAAFAAERDQTRQTLERNEVNRLLGSIIEQRKREAKVQYDKPLLEQFGMLGDEAKGT